jgi:hypothetical protein
MASGHDGRPQGASSPICVRCAPSRSRYLLDRAFHPTFR